MPAPAREGHRLPIVGGVFGPSAEQREQARGLREDTGLSEERNLALLQVAEQSGGGYTEIRPNQDLAEAFARVVDELHSQYLIGFAPPKRDGKVHDIEVKIPTQRGLKPRARKNYVAPAGKP